MKTLLQLAIEKTTENRADTFVRTLLSAGANPAFYNEHLGLAPIHVAAKQVLTVKPHRYFLLICEANKITFKYMGFFLQLEL